MVIFGEFVAGHGVVVVPGVDDEFGDAVAVHVAEGGPFVLLEFGIDEDVFGPWGAVGEAFFAGVFEPGDFAVHEGAADDVEPAVAVDVPGVFGVIGHVVFAEGEESAERFFFFEVGAWIPEFACADVWVSVVIEVGDGAAFVVVEVELLDAEFEAGGFVLCVCLLEVAGEGRAEGDADEDRDCVTDFHVTCMIKTLCRWCVMLQSGFSLEF